MKTLFEQPLSHTNDPQTSFDAADKILKSGKLNKQENEVLKAIRFADKNMKECLSPEHCNFTAKQIHQWGGLDYFIIQRRLSGLRNKGKIERTGEKRDGCCVWRLI